MMSALKDHVAWVLLWAALVVAGLSYRPLLPIDETRYAAVAWEMWDQGHFLVPHLHGQVYAQKPPLLFWMIHTGWWLFGVHDWVTRLVPTFFALFSLFLTFQLARLLWPDEPETARTAPYVVLGLLYWNAFASLLMFDMLMVCFALLVLTGVATVWRGKGNRGWLLAGLGIGLGLLAKGPVIFTFTLPVALGARWWMGGAPPGGWGRWYGGVVISITVGAAICLAWVLPAIHFGGDAYRQAILWDQTAGRIVSSFAHQAPWWWYFPMLPLALLPYSLMTGFWRRLLSGWRSGLGPAERFCIVWFVSALLILSMVSGKQLHYLLPAYPAFALLLAHLLATAKRTNEDHLLLAVQYAAGGFLFLVIPEARHWLELPAWIDRIPAMWGVVLVVCAISLMVCEGETGMLLRRTASCTVILVVVSHVAIGGPGGHEFDTAVLGEQLARIQAEGVPVAATNSYHGEFHFAGRLHRPVGILMGSEVKDWVERHPDGVLLHRHRHLQENEKAMPEFVSRFRGRDVALWRARKLVQDLDPVMREFQE